jgi:hypothetical protein
MNSSLFWSSITESLEVLRVTFILQKDNKTDHLRDKELFTTTKPQKPVELTIDNSQLNRN